MWSRRQASGEGPPGPGGTRRSEALPCAWPCPACQERPPSLACAGVRRRAPGEAGPKEAQTGGGGGAAILASSGGSVGSADVLGSGPSAGEETYEGSIMQGRSTRLSRLHRGVSRSQARPAAAWLGHWRAPPAMQQQLMLASAAAGMF